MPASSAEPEPVVDEKHDTVGELVATARRRGGEHLTERQGLEIAATLGLGIPRCLEAADTGALAELDLDLLPGDEVVLKLSLPGLAHKTEVGGVAMLPKRRSELVREAERMQRDLPGRSATFLLQERVPHDSRFGGELLLALRHTREFGPVVCCGAGGLLTEALGEWLRPEVGILVLSPDLTEPSRLRESLAGRAAPAALTDAQRGAPPRLPIEQLERVLGALLELARRAPGLGLVELELNPVALSGDRLVALDAKGRLAEPWQHRPPRPILDAKRLLRPTSMAVVGVSRSLNPGHTLLRNTLDAGFDRHRLWVVKPDCDQIEGCRCVPSLEALSEPVDLLVLALDAGASTELVERACGDRLARHIVLIAGGFGESGVGGELAGRVATALATARRRDEASAPRILGANCLGLRSRPGRYDTLFVPRSKLGLTGGRPVPLALLSQSGAFALSRLDHLGPLEPRYVITLGNQLDLTLGEALEAVATDPEVAVFACYVEGFRDLDGLRFLEAARAVTESGRTLLLYRAARTGRGAEASASHTASLAGDATVSRELATAAGVLTVETLQELEDLVRVALGLHDRPIAGRRLAVVTNAGFEAVTIADAAGRLELAPFDEDLRRRISRVLDEQRLGSLVALNNPLDTTPMLGDAGFLEVVREVMLHPAVDVSLVGCVPFTAALSTLPREAEGEGVSLLAGLPALAELGRPWIAVVDAGSAYDPLAMGMEAAGVPVFRYADRAVRALARYCDHRLARALL